MPKHKKLHHGGKYSSSSSSSSSDSSDDEYKHLPKHERKKMKKWKKDYKKGRIPAGSVPPWKVAGYAPGPGNYAHPPHGAHHNVTNTYPGQHGGYPAGGGGYPPPSGGYPPAAGGVPGYPQTQGQYPPPQQGAGGFSVPAGQYPPPNTSGYPPGPEPEKDDDDSSYDEDEDFALDEAECAELLSEKEEKEEVEEVDEEEKKKKKLRRLRRKKKKLHKKKIRAKRQDADEVDDTSDPRAPTPPPEEQMPTVTLDDVAETYHPTVKNSDEFSVEADVETLRNSMTGTGTEEAPIIELISNRSNSQRQEIEKTYKTMYGKDLVEDLDSELSGNLKETVMALFKSPTFYDAWSLHKAMKGPGTKDSVLIEILCTRSNQQIAAIKECYLEHFGRNLEDDITGDTTGYFKRLLVSCCQANRNELTEEQIQSVLSDGAESIIDRDQAKQDAEKLYAAGEQKFGTDESAFIEVLALRNFYQLTAVFDEYQKIAGKDILESIDSEMSGNIESGLKAIVRSARNRPEYFAYKLYKAMNLVGTNDSTLIRIIVSRSEIDLADIKEAYEKRYGKTLAAAIDSDTSGDYKQLLLSLVRD